LSEKGKIAGKIIFLILLTIGLILAIWGGFSSSNQINIWMGSGSTSAFNSSATYAGIAFGGVFCCMIGFVIFMFTHQGSIARFQAKQNAEALEISARAISRGFNLDTENENIKIKCRTCGYLESEDAEFCSKCGNRL